VGGRFKKNSVWTSSREHVGNKVAENNGGGRKARSVRKKKTCASTRKSRNLAEPRRKKKGKRGELKTESEQHGNSEQRQSGAGEKLTTTRGNTEAKKKRREKYKTDLWEEEHLREKGGRGSRGQREDPKHTDQSGVKRAKKKNAVKNGQISKRRRKEQRNEARPLRVDGRYEKGRWWETGEIQDQDRACLFKRLGREKKKKRRQNRELENLRKKKVAGPL